eukprot:Opistho-2@88271
MQCASQMRVGCRRDNGGNGAPIARHLKVLEDLDVGVVDRRQTLNLLLGIRVKVACVARSLDVGDERGGNLELVEGDPVDAVEEGMVLDVVDAALHVAEAPRQIRRAQVADEVNFVRLKVFGKRNAPRNNLLVDAHRVGIRKWRVARKHFKNENAQRPPVDGVAVALAQNDLGGEVLGRAAQRPGAVKHTLGKSKVSNADVSAVVEKQVLGLQIPVDDIKVVQVVESHGDLGGVDTRHGRGEAAVRVQVGEHFASVNILQHNVEIARVLKRGNHVDDKRAVHCRKQLLLVHYVLDLFCPHDAFLLQHLESTILSRLCIL